MAKDDAPVFSGVKPSKGYQVFTVCNNILMVIICVAMLYPFLYLIAQSFSSTEAIYAGKVSIVPVGFSLDTYKYILGNDVFLPDYLNTIIYAAIGTVCALFFSALLAYPLSKEFLRANKIIGPLIIFTMYFGGGMIPNYILMISLGLQDTVAAFILPGVLSTYYNR